MNDEKLGRKTSPGFGDPRAAVRSLPAQAIDSRRPLRADAAASRAATRQAPSRSSAAPALSGAREGRSRPLVEVEVVHERTRSPRPQPFPGCYEIWTQNHVYALDARMRCIEVRTPQSNELRADHPFLGGRLVGGQAEEDAMEMSHPLPRPGAFAVFELRKKCRRQFVRTSPVERVVLRLRIVTIADGGDAPCWDEVAEPEE